MPKKGISTLAAVVIVAAVLVATGVIKLSGFSTVSPGGLVDTNQPVQAGAGFQCQEDGSNTLNVAVRDGLVTTSTLYTPVTVAFTSGNRIIATQASNPGTTLSYAAGTLLCGDGSNLEGTAMILAGPGASTNYASAPYDARVLSDEVVLSSTNTTNLQFAIRDISSNTNTSVLDADGYSEISANETAPTTVAANSVRSVNVDLVGITGSRQFGSELGVIWSVDTSDSSVFSDNSISLSSSSIALQPVTCPSRATSFNSANRCYKSGPIKTSDGTLRFTISQNADLGNPGTSADPRIYLDDMQGFEEDGVVVFDIYDKGGNNVGASRQQIGLDNS